MTQTDDDKWKKEMCHEVLGAWIKEVDPGAYAITITAHCLIPKCEHEPGEHFAAGCILGVKIVEDFILQIAESIRDALLYIKEAPDRETAEKELKARGFEAP